MMAFTIGLDDTDIARVLAEVKQMKQNLEDSVGEFVDTMTTEGAITANAAYGNMVHAVAVRDKEDDGLVEGHIGVVGDDDDTVYIAEFGAGDATMTTYGFDNPPPVNIYPGAYSEQNGPGEYYRTMTENYMAGGEAKGVWHFGGQEYHEVQPRHGLLNAKQRLVSGGDSIAKAVIHL
jgi:hypothetical protein